jgi:hypothetical protein
MTSPDFLLLVAQLVVILVLGDCVVSAINLNGFQARVAEDAITSNHTMKF